MKRRNNIKRIVLKKEFNQSTIWSKLLSWNGLIIASVPFVFYFIYYQYLLVKFDYFKIPYDFISFRVEDYISFFYKGGFYFILYPPVVFFANASFITLVTLKKAKKKITINAYFVSFLYLFTGVMLFVLSFLYFRQKSVVEGISSFVMGLHFLILYYFFLIPSVTSVIYNWPKNIYNNIRRKLVENPIMKIIIEKQIFFYLLCLIIYIGVINMSSSIVGLREMQEQKNYYVVHATQDCVILHFNGDKALCAPFSRQEKEVETNFIYIDLANNPEVRISYEEIGPIHVKPTPTRSPQPTFTPTVTNTPLPTFTPVPTENPKDQ